MIKLSDQRPIGRGSHREVYLHPTDNTFCLKVMIEDWKESGRRRRASWLSRVCRPKRYFHENLGELHFSKKQVARIGDRAENYLALSEKMVETDKGRALKVQFIRDHDGAISLSLKAYLLKFGKTDELTVAIHNFWEGVLKHGLFLQGRPDNVLVKQQADGSCQLIAIDGFGLPHILPLAKWFMHFRRRFLNKRLAKQNKSIETILAARESGKNLGNKGMVLE